eukprot:SAG11_NODE_16253_length_553_cov_0.718062_1_plen_83_part_00
MTSHGSQLHIRESTASVWCKTSALQHRINETKAARSEFDSEFLYPEFDADWLMDSSATSNTTGLQVSGGRYNVTKVSRLRVH